MRHDLSLVEQSLRAERPAAERAAEVICEELKSRSLLPPETSISLEGHSLEG